MYIRSDFFDQQELSFPDLSKHLDCSLYELEPFAAAHRKNEKEYPVSINGFYKWLNTTLSENDPQTIIRCTDISLAMLVRLVSDKRRVEKLTLKSLAVIEAIVEHFKDPQTKKSST